MLSSAMLLALSSTVQTGSLSSEHIMAFLPQSPNDARSFPKHIIKSVTAIIYSLLIISVLIRVLIAVIKYHGQS
ncbi:rCG30522 [Rattus norvegicus]|uniref:RCG30522 n=1 Tax=Rattus norvegicus TaxID=10116 RepID=A6JFK2_RAT|nr:rCG30522 [Rattus norvegicus]